MAIQSLQSQHVQIMCKHCLLVLVYVYSHFLANILMRTMHHGAPCACPEFVVTLRYGSMGRTEFARYSYESIVYTARPRSKCSGYVTSYRKSVYNW
jgi:hypothetical protein